MEELRERLAAAEGRAEAAEQALAAERERARQALADHEALLAALDVSRERQRVIDALGARVLHGLSDAVLVVEDGLVLAVNPAFCAITGYREAEILGRRADVLDADGPESDLDVAPLRQAGPGSVEGERWIRRADAACIVVHFRVTRLPGANGPDQVVHLFSDVTARKRDERAQWRQANFDAVTGLPNRHLLMDRLTGAIERSRRSGRRAALLFVDLDGFKAVNDGSGHALGDLLLAAVAQRFVSVARARDTVARYGGDEFCVVLDNLDGAGEAVAVAARLLGVLASPFDVPGGGTCRLGASVGVAVIPDDAQDPGGALERADAAMYAAKAAGRNAVSLAGSLGPGGPPGRSA